MSIVSRLRNSPLVLVTTLSLLDHSIDSPSGPPLPVLIPCKSFLTVATTGFLNTFIEQCTLLLKISTYFPSQQDKIQMSCPGCQAPSDLLTAYLAALLPATALPLTFSLFFRTEYVPSILQPHCLCIHVPSAQNALPSDFHRCPFLSFRSLLMIFSDH